MKEELVQRVNDDILEDNSLIIDWILMASYQYYIKNTTIMSDGMFDALWRMLIDQWGSIDHPNKKIINKKDLSIGSLYYIKSEEYPQSVKRQSEKWI